MSSTCHAGKAATISYGGVLSEQTFAGDGTLSAVIDPFLGGTETATIRYTDGTEQTLAIIANDLANYTKVAVIWDGPAQVDLHAFEYSASQNAKGHIWHEAASSFNAAVANMKDIGQFHGFLTERGSKASGKRVQVYTVLSNPPGNDTGTLLQTGVIKLAIDYFQTVQTSQNCTTIAAADTNLTVIRSNGIAAPSVRELFASVDACASRNALSARLHPEAVEDIRLGAR